jgi:hypothetical protein
MLSNYNLAMNLPRKKGKLMVLQRLLAPLELDNVDVIFKELKSKHPDMAWQTPSLGYGRRYR